MQEIENIKKIIADGNTKTAIERLVNFLQTKNDKLYQSSLLIQSQWSNFERDAKIHRLISNNESSIVHNQINNSILLLLENLTYSDELEDKLTSITKKNQHNKYFIFGLTVALISLCLLFVNLYNDSKLLQIELAKRAEYIKTLQFKSQELIQIGNEISKEIPEFAQFVDEFQNLQNLHIKATQEGNLSLKSEILRKIHDLPVKYNLANINNLQFAKNHVTELKKQDNSNVTQSNPELDFKRNYLARELTILNNKVETTRHEALSTIYELKKQNLFLQKQLDSLSNKQ